MSVGDSDKAMVGMDYVWPGKVTLVIDPFYFWMQLGTSKWLIDFSH